MSQNEKPRYKTMISVLSIYDRTDVVDVWRGMDQWHWGSWLSRQEKKKLNAVLTLLTKKKFEVSRRCDLPEWFFFLFFKDFIYLLSERREGREKHRERNISVGEIHGSVASCAPLTGDQAHSPGMCPDWESNWWPLSVPGLPAKCSVGGMLEASKHALIYLPLFLPPFLSPKINK